MNSLQITAVVYSTDIDKPSYALFYGIEKINVVRKTIEVLCALIELLY